VELKLKLKLELELEPVPVDVDVPGSGPQSGTWNLDLGTRAPADALSACS